MLEVLARFELRGVYLCHTLMQCMKLKVAFKVSFYFEECFHHEILPDVDADVESVMFQQKSYFFLNRDGLFHDIVIHL